MKEMNRDAEGNERRWCEIRVKHTLSYFLIWQPKIPPADQAGRAGNAMTMFPLPLQNPQHQVQKLVHRRDY